VRLAGFRRRQRAGVTGLERLQKMAEQSSTSERERLIARAAWRSWTEAALTSTRSMPMVWTAMRRLRTLTFLPVP
jgi:hypothetical protein